MLARTWEESFISYSNKVVRTLRRTDPNLENRERDVSKPVRTGYGRKGNIAFTCSVYLIFQKFALWKVICLI
ncbi:hypothetical protein JTE90_011475 [Oedothorax gibbosus]|uniref:Uncharacterized protein n=1 Tax=Oedothorax gibbosus TaxID=931172 RepID=A0AAV6VAX5_9ARAC|nr:hypothetical protein JTE90_011475 [Oedothorax gibbosus]